MLRWADVGSSTNPVLFEILQIVPQLPPAISGVGDYAYLLARQLRAAHDIHTKFVVCDPQWENAESGKLKTETGEPTINHQPSTTLDGFPIYHLKEQSAAELLRVLSAEGMPSTVLLQYVGYGYEKRGCPVWLARGLDRWKNQKAETRNPNSLSQFQLSAFSLSARPRLVTMFHELYASGPPWRSSFWTSPIQRWLVMHLATASGHCVTNLRLCGRVLGKMTGQSEACTTVLPVFSNVGEPTQKPDYHERPPRLAVFGTPNWRRQAYVEYRRDLEQLCASLGLDEIVDVGAPCGELPALSISRTEKGSLTPELVSQELLSCRAGFFAYAVPYLGKSGIFAAYAAHGLVPVTYGANRGESEDGMRSGEHFLRPSALSDRDAQRLEGVRSNVIEWYGRHDLKAQAFFYARAIQPADRRYKIASHLLESST